MNLVKRGIFTAVAASVLGVLTGCDTVTSVKQENERLQMQTIKQEQINRELMAQLEAMRGRQGGSVIVDESETARLRALLAQKEQQEASYKRALAAMQGKVVLSERVMNKLHQLAEQLGGEVDGNKLLLPCDYFFASGHYEMMPEGRKKLAILSKTLRDENLMLMIVGHTDADPIKNLKARGITTNRQLSLMRALSVLESMKGEGYPEQFMYPTGWGELRPVAGNATRNEKQLNRRVEIYVDPVGSGMLDDAAIVNVNPTTTTSTSTTTTYSSTYDAGPITIGE